MFKYYKKYYVSERGVLHLSHPIFCSCLSKLKSDHFQFLPITLYFVAPSRVTNLFLSHCTYLLMSHFFSFDLRGHRFVVFKDVVSILFDSYSLSLVRLHMTFSVQIRRHDVFLPSRKFSS